MTARQAFRLHGWLGIVGGLMLFVLCWSGTVATVAHEIDWLLTPALRVAPTTAPLSLDRLHRSVRQRLPEATIRSVHAPVGGRFAALAWVDLPGQGATRVYLDPATGAVRGLSRHLTVQRFFRSFHIALVGGTWGLWLVWLMALPFVLSVLTPLWFYRRWWRRFFDLRWRGDLRARLSMLHRLGGLWGWGFALLIAVTALWFLFEAVRSDLLDGKWTWIGEGRQAVHALAPIGSSGSEVDLPALMSQVAVVRPDLVPRVLSWTRGGHLLVVGQSYHWLVRDRANKVYLDPSDGRVIASQDAGDLPLYWRWSDTADPLHFGDFGGLPVKLLWCGGGLLLSALCLSGAWLHGQRLAGGGVPRAGARTALLVVSAILLVAGWQTQQLFARHAATGMQLPGEQAAMVFVAGWLLSLLVVPAAWWRLISRRRRRDRGSAAAAPR